MAKAISKERANAILMGSDSQEPTIDLVNYTHSISSALNFYNNSFSLSEYKEATLEYASSVGIHMNRGIPEYQFRTVGAICRLILRKCDIKPEDIERNLLKLKNIQKEYEKSKLNEVVVVSNVIPIKQIDYLVVDYLNSIEDALIENILNNKDYNLAEYISAFTKNEYKKSQSNEIVNFINSKIRYYDGVYSLLKGGCEQTKESFDNIPSTRIKSVLKTLKMLLEGISVIQHKEIVVKQVRKKKELSPLLQCKNIPYKKTWEGIDGLNPTACINSGEVWVFDTDTRDVIVLRALKDLKFTAKGYTFNNVDESKSFKKKLRKIEDIYLFTNTLENLTKKSLLTTFTSIKTKEQKASGRMNENKIIIKVFK